MPSLGRLWAGRVFGTNTGNFFLELTSSPDGAVIGTFRLMDSLSGLIVYAVTGTFDGSEVMFSGSSAGADGGQGVDETFEARGTLTSAGNIQGTWSSSIGTAGSFEAFPHDQVSVPPAPTRPAVVTQPPEQLYTSTISVGAVRLYGDELWQLITSIRKDFLVGRMVVTYSIRGNEVTKYLDDFKDEAVTLRKLTRLKLTIQEPEAHGINKLVVLDLPALGQNEIRVQGINETWVTGKAEATMRMLRSFESGLVTTYKRFGLNVNQLIFLAMLVLIPAIHSVWQRGLFVVFTIVLLQILFWLHQRFIPNAVLYFAQQEPKFIERAFPSIISWGIAATAGLAVAFIFRWLTK